MRCFFLNITLLHGYRALCVYQDTLITIWMQPTKEPFSLRLDGNVCILWTPPKNRLCGRDRCQNPFGDIIITSGN